MQTSSANTTHGETTSESQLSSVVEQRFCKSPCLVPLAPIPLNKPFVLAAGTLCHGQGVKMETFFRAFEAESFYSRRLKPASKQYRKDNLLYLKRTWPSLENRDVATITPMECLEWSGTLKYAATRFNAIIGLLKNLFTMAVTAGVIQSNPADCIERIPVRIKPPKLPSYDQFRKVISYLESSPESRRAVRLVKFLAYSGLRIGEALKLTRDDITEYGIRVSDAKNGEDAFVPILPEMAELIKTLPTDGRPLFRVKNPRKALANACRAAGTAPLTNHQLRHLFATRCIECGVDIKTVAEWLRHKDGGALALKRYSHVRNEHSAAMAAKVRF
jgi:integrase